MKQLLILFFLLIALRSFSQCEECTSFKEALKKPEMAKSIMINGSVNGLKLDSIPEFIGTFTNLEILYLTDHNIKTLPPEIGKLTKLKELSFGGCKLVTIPDFIFTLKNLKELILFDNAFSADYRIQLKSRLKKEMPGTKLLIDI